MVDLALIAKPRQNSCHHYGTTAQPAHRLVKVIFTAVTLFAAFSNATDQKHEGCFSLAKQARTIYADPHGDSKVEWVLPPGATSAILKTSLQGPFLASLDQETDNAICMEIRTAKHIITSFKRLPRNDGFVDGAKTVALENLSSAVTIQTDESRILWRLGEEQLGPSSAGPWQVELSTEHGTTLLAFTLEVLSSCLEQQSSLIIEAPIWPGDPASIIDVPISSQQGRHWRPPLHEDCESLDMTPPIEVLSLTSNGNFKDAIILADSDKPGHIRVKLDPMKLKNVELDDTTTNLTVLSKSGGTFKSIFKAQVQLIDCPGGVFSDRVDPVLAIAQQTDGVEDNAEPFKVITLITEAGPDTFLTESPDQEQAAVVDESEARDVRLVLLDPQKEALAQKCLAKLPSDMVLRCNHQSLSSLQPGQPPDQTSADEGTGQSHSSSEVNFASEPVLDLNQCKFERKSSELQLDTASESQKRRLQVKCEYDTTDLPRIFPGGIFSSKSYYVKVTCTPASYTKYYVAAKFSNVEIFRTMQTFNFVEGGTEQIASFEYQVLDSIYDEANGYESEGSFSHNEVIDLEIKDQSSALYLQIIFYKCSDSDIQYQLYRKNYAPLPSPCMSCTWTTSPKPETFGFTDMKVDQQVVLYGIASTELCFGKGQHVAYVFTKDEFESTDVSQYLSDTDEVVKEFQTELNAYLPRRFDSVLTVSYIDPTSHAFSITVKKGLTSTVISAAGITDSVPDDEFAAQFVIAHVFMFEGKAFAVKTHPFDIKVSCAYTIVTSIGPLVDKQTLTRYDETPGQSVLFFHEIWFKYDPELESLLDTSKTFGWQKNVSTDEWPCLRSQVQVKVTDIGTHSYPISTSQAKGAYISSQDWTLEIGSESDVSSFPTSESESKLQSLQFDLRFYGREIYTGYIDIMVGFSTPELVVQDQIAIDAQDASTESLVKVVKVAKELSPSLTLNPSFFFRPENGNYFGTESVDDTIDRVSYTDSWIPSFEHDSLELQLITKDHQALIHFQQNQSSSYWRLVAYFVDHSSPITVPFTGALQRTETWQLGNYEISKTFSVIFEETSVFTSEHVELIVEIKEQVIPEFTVQMNIHGEPAPAESFVYMNYTIDYRITKEPEPFTPTLWTDQTWTYHVYKSGDSIKNDANFDTGTINSVADASPDFNDEVTLSVDWETNPISFRCQPWALEFQDMPIETSFYVQNSIDPQIQAQVHAVCIYAPCENRIALEQGFFKFPDQQDEVIENIFPWVHYPSVQQKLPQIESYCDFTKVQELELARITHADGVTLLVTQERLSADYGVTLNGNILDMQTDNVDLYGTIIDLIFKDTVVEESTWFNTTHFTLEFTKPPCFVTSDDIERVAGGLSISLYAKKTETSDQFQIQTFELTIVKAFNQTEEFWCGAIDTEFEADGDYLTFEKSSKLIVLNPQSNDPTGMFSGSLLRYFYVDYPQKRLEVPIYVTIEGCDNFEVEFSQSSVLYEVVLGRTDSVVIQAPFLKSQAACAGEVTASYSLQPLSLPAEATSLDQFFVFDKQEHFFIIQPMLDFSMLGKAVSGTFRSQPSELDQIFAITVSVQYITYGPEFQQMTEEEMNNIPQITCSEKDTKWSFTLTPIVGQEQMSVQTELLEEPEISKMFMIADDDTVTLKPRFKEKVASGDLCPSEDSFELFFQLTSDLLGKSTQSLTYFVEPVDTGADRVSFEGVDPDTAYLRTRGEDFKQPSIKFSSISVTGELILSFSSRFLVPDDLTRLKAKELVIDGVKRSNLELIIEPVEGQTKEDLNFDWEVLSFLPEKLTMQLNFEKPYMISQASEKNQVQVNIWDPSLFIREDDFVPIAPLTSITNELPKVTTKSTAETIMEVAITISTAGKGAVVFIFLLGFFFNMGMNHILSKVQNLSIITHMMMMQLSYPATMALFFSKIFEFVTFDIIPTEKIYPHMFDLEADPFSEEADDVGFYSRFILHNAGSITIFILGQIVAQALFLLLAHTLPQSKALSFVRNKRSAYKWSGLVDFFTDIYLTLSFCVCINLSKMQIDDAITGFNNVYCGITGLLLVSGPILIVFGLDQGWKEYVSLPLDVEASELELESRQEEEKKGNEEEKDESQPPDNNEDQLVSLGEEGLGARMEAPRGGDLHHPSIQLAANEPINDNIRRTGTVDHRDNHIGLVNEIDELFGGNANDVEEKKSTSMINTSDPPKAYTVNRPQLRSALFKESDYVSRGRAPAITSSQKVKLRSACYAESDLKQNSASSNPGGPISKLLRQQNHLWDPSKRDESAINTNNVEQISSYNNLPMINTSDAPKAYTYNKPKLRSAIYSESDYKEGGEPCLDQQIQDRQMRHFEKVLSRQDEMQDSHYKQVASRFGSTASNLKGRKQLSPRKAKFFILVSYYRLLALAGIIIGLHSMPTLQILGTILLWLSWTIILLALWPFESRSENISLFVSELSILVILYFLVCLTGEFVPEEKRESISIFLISLTATNFTVNVSIVLVINRLAIKNWCKKKLYCRRCNRQRGENTTDGTRQSDSVVRVEVMNQEPPQERADPSQLNDGSPAINDDYDDAEPEQSQVVNDQKRDDQDRGASRQRKKPKKKRQPERRPPADSTTINGVSQDVDVDVTDHSEVPDQELIKRDAQLRDSIEEFVRSVDRNFKAKRQHELLVYKEANDQFFGLPDKSTLSEEERQRRIDKIVHQRAKLGYKTKQLNRLRQVRAMPHPSNAIMQCTGRDRALYQLCVQNSIEPSQALEEIVDMPKFDGDEESTVDEHLFDDSQLKLHQRLQLQVHVIRTESSNSD